MNVFTLRMPLALGSLILAGACAASAPANTSDGAGGSGEVASSTSASSSSSSAASSSSSSSGMPGPSSVSLLSLNLHCFRLDGTVYTTNADRFAAIAALVSSRDVSAIALQEACQRPAESALDELRTALEKATMTSWSSTWTFAHIAWEGTTDQADEGVGLLVKGALSSPREWPLAVQGSLRRVATSATLPMEWSNVHLTSVHFEVFESAARTMQAREVAVGALVDTDPNFNAIVAGDFNDIEGSAPHDAFRASGYIAADAGLDAAGIDHVMVHRGTNWRATTAEKVFLGAEAVSDHPGILVRFEPAAQDTIAATRIRVMANLAPNQFASIRGNVPPLSWNLGFPVQQSVPGQYGFVSTELVGSFEYKILIDDQTWQTGPNASGVAGTDLMVMPTF